MSQDDEHCLVLESESTLLNHLATPNELSEAGAQWDSQRVMTASTY
jgi:hypothetical protein